jgi:hypothetical protein
MGVPNEMVSQFRFPTRVAPMADGVRALGRTLAINAQLVPTSPVLLGAVEREVCKGLPVRDRTQEETVAVGRFIVYFTRAAARGMVRSGSA